MKLLPLPLPPDQILVNTRLLSDRWGVDCRTVLRVCRFHELPEIQLVEGGRVLYPRDAIEDLERYLFGRN